MQREYHTYCDFQIGDSLIHLHFLRKLAKMYPERRFFHGVNTAHFPQMREVIEDLPQIQLTNCADRPADSHLIWKNWNGFWQHHKLRNDYAGFHLDWFKSLSARMGVENPFKTPEDLAFDYPALLKPTPLSAPFDVLFINSPPCSGQFREFLSGPGGSNNPELFADLIGRLSSRYRVITTAHCSTSPCCTLDHEISCTGIGNLSLFCHTIVGVSTGPSWPTFNVWNWHTAKNRIIFLNDEYLNMAPNTVEVGTVAQAEDQLRRIGLL